MYKVFENRKWIEKNMIANEKLQKENKDRKDFLKVKEP